jgi:BlaI family transcriptional regulator, penicillinase repressor
MARPKAKELTERELEVMHAFWRRCAASEQATAADIRDELANAGRELAYTTVATLVRILCDKGFLEQTNQERPFTYRPLRSFDEVSGSLVGDLVERLFGGQRDQLLLRLLEERKLTAKERAVLEEVLREKKK